MAEIIVANGKLVRDPKPVRGRQMRYLELVIAESIDATDFGKQALIWMLRQTDGLSRNIAVSLPFSWGKQTVRGVYKSVHDMCSDNGSTHLWRTFAAMGVGSGINSHCGLYEGQAQKLNHDLPGYTVWISNRASYDHTAERIEPDFNAIQSINISPEAIYGDGFNDSEKEISLHRSV